MGNDVIRAVQKPWHDLMKYCCNACDSECGSPCGSCHIKTTETGEESPDLIEKEIHVQRHTIPSGVERGI